MPDDRDATETPMPQDPPWQGPVEKRGGQTAPPNPPEPLRSIDLPIPPRMPQEPQPQAEPTTAGDDT
jgi:hypothetical protein